MRFRNNLHVLPTPRREHPLAASIWDIRVQAIWIGFAIIYVVTDSIFVSKPEYERLLSSIFLTLVSGLLLFLMIYNVVSKDKSASRKTLLVVLTVCGFIAQKSSEVYHDKTGTVFATFFSIIVFSQIWLKDDSISREKIRIYTICFLLTAMIFSLFGLIATVLERYYLSINNLPDKSMVIAPHVAIIVVGLSSFSACIWRIFPHKKFPSEYSYPWTVIAYRLIFACVVAILITAITNSERHPGNSYGTYELILFSMIFVMPFTSATIAMIIVMSFSKKSHFTNFVTFICVGLLCSEFSAIAHQKLQLGLFQPISGFGIPFLYFYSIPIVFVLLSTYITQRIFVYICEDLFEDYQEPTPEWQDA